jgi:hypothetical protein
MASQTVSHQSPQSQSSQSVRRIVTLDIETIPLDPTDSKGALDAMTGRIVCIGLLVDDGERLSPEPICDLDERRLLERFWAALHDTDLLVGHNILGFDLMFIRQRSWILGIKPPLALNLRKYYTDQVVDLMELWTNWSSRFKGASLENIAQALGCGEKTGHGTDVAIWWANRDYGSIVKYCMDDVWLSYGVYCRMTYREPLGAPLPGRVSADQRALVSVRTQEQVAPAQMALVAASSSAPAAATAPQVPTMAARATTPRGVRRHKDSRRQEPREIVCRAAGDSLVLTGATFPIRDTLKKVFSARGSKNGDSFQWEVGANHFAALAGLCQKTGIRLVQTA